MKSNIFTLSALVAASVLAGCATQLDRDVSSAVASAPNHLSPQGLIRSGDTPVGSPDSKIWSP